MNIPWRKNMHQCALKGCGARFLRVYYNQKFCTPAHQKLNQSRVSAQRRKNAASI